MAIWYWSVVESIHDQTCFVESATLLRFLEYLDYFLTSPKLIDLYLKRFHLIRVDEYLLDYRYCKIIL